MANIDVLEWIGYLASILVLLSMLMNSILKLRIVNMIGALIFSIYGFLIGAMPVGWLNLFVVFANMYHLYKMFAVKESFTTLEIRSNSRYLAKFLDFHAQDIAKYFPKFKYKEDVNAYSFFILRNMAVAGVFMARDYKEETLFIGLDFVINQYRDLKPGKFIYSEKLEFFKSEGYNKLCTIPQSVNHEKYLRKMGFISETIDEEKHLVFNF